MTTIFALLGPTALWLLYSLLASAIIASYLSGRKGYGERVGLASGLLLNVIGVIVWLASAPYSADPREARFGIWKHTPLEPARPGLVVTDVYERLHKLVVCSGHISPLSTFLPRLYWTG